MASLCNGCEDNYMSAFARFYDKDDVAKPPWLRDEIMGLGWVGLG